MTNDNINLEDWVATSDFVEMHNKNAVKSDQRTRQRFQQMMAGYSLPLKGGKETYEPVMQEGVHFIKIGRFYYIHKTVKIKDGKVTGGVEPQKKKAG